MIRGRTDRSSASVRTILAVMLIATGALTEVGCTTSTVTAESRATVTGRIYDENGAPISGVRVETRLSDGVSDDTGRFRLDNVPHGDRVLRVYRRGYETQTVEIALHSPHAFARITLWSLTGLVDQAIDYLQEGALGEAARVHQRCRLVDPRDERVKILGVLVGGPR